MLKRALQLIVLALLLAVAWFAWALLEPVQPAARQSVLLRPGSSARRIAHQLRDAGVIRSEPAFLLLHYYYRKPLRAGEYLFEHPADTVEVYERIAEGDITVHAVSIPEGYNIFDIASAVEQAGLAPRDAFLQVLRSETSLISDLDPGASSLEGFLYPDTYYFTRTQSPHDMAAAMVARFRQESRALGMTGNVHDVVTLASIVEKETGAPEERPLIASVYTNRLMRKIVLAADPTVIYGAHLAGRYRGAIFQSDLEFDSPYNTYRHAGLPPGPIASPGRASLAATLHPPNTEYLYFVSDNHGHSRFARTAREHSRNVAMYRRSVTGKPR